MVDKISSQWVSRLRSSSGGKASSAVATGSRRSVPGSDAQAAGAGIEWQDQVRHRILALEPDDPQRQRKVLRLFVEASLVREFGPQLANDASFQLVVDDVMRAMEEEPELRESIDAAVNLLQVERP